MYFVNREKMEEILTYMESLLSEINAHSYKGFADFLLLERLIHISIESIIDIGNMMIDGFIMRDPGSYEDIIDILTDEKVLPATEQKSYIRFIQVRKDLVRNYTSIDHDKILNIWKEEKEVLMRYPERIRTYLDQELGPVSAFTKE